MGCSGEQRELPVARWPKGSYEKYENTTPLPGEVARRDREAQNYGRGRVVAPMVAVVKEDDRHIDLSDLCG
jgi:hypothetical protein